MNEARYHPSGIPIVCLTIILMMILVGCAPEKDMDEPDGTAFSDTIENQNWIESNTDSQMDPNPTMEPRSLMRIPGVDPLVWGIGKWNNSQWISESTLVWGARKWGVHSYSS